MPTAQKKNFNTPDETRNLPKATVDFVKVGEATLVRATYEPGWKWSDHAKPVVGTDSCQMLHFGYLVSGQLHVVMSDGTVLEVGQGDAVLIPPGHDAWVVGSEPCVLLDLPGAYPTGK